MAAQQLRKPLLWFDLPKSWSILQQLVLEETVLRCSRTNSFMFKQGTPQKTIVMGFSAKPAELIDIEAVNRDNILVLRRYTGGGTVIVDHNSIFTSWILNSADANTQPYPREIMKWSETMFQPVFDELIKKEHKFTLLENDYIVDDKKIGGNAQTITKDRWVHHTSFLWDFDNLNMNYLQMPKKRPEYRQSRPHGDFLRKLHPICQGSPDTFRQLILKRTQELYDVRIISDEKEIEDVRQQMIAEQPDFQIRTKVEEFA